MNHKYLAIRIHIVLILVNGLIIVRCVRIIRDYLGYLDLNLRIRGYTPF